MNRRTDEANEPTIESAVSVRYQVLNYLFPISDRAPILLHVLLCDR